jgi:glycosyl transferase family 25
MLNHIYVINLDKDTKRLETITKSFDKQGLWFNRFAAIVGNKLDSEDINDNVEDFCKKIGCTSGMIGCGLSHMSLYRQLIDDPTTDRYIIMEDDAIIDEKFEPTIRELETTFVDYDVLYLRCMSTINCLHISEFAKTRTGFRIGKSIAPVTLAGYIITKEGAKKILKESSKLRWHIDISLLDMSNKNIINLYTLQPNLVKLSSESISSTLTTFKSYSPSLIIVNKFDETLYWWSTVPLISIKRTFTINSHFVIVILLLLILSRYTDNKILLWFLTIELIIATLLVLNIL